MLGPFSLRLYFRTHFIESTKMFSIWLGRALWMDRIIKELGKMMKMMFICVYTYSTTLLTDVDIHLHSIKCIIYEFNKITLWNVVVDFKQIIRTIAFINWITKTKCSHSQMERYVLYTIKQNANLYLEQWKLRRIINLFCAIVILF